MAPCWCNRELVPFWSSPEHFSSAAVSSFNYIDFTGAGFCGTLPRFDIVLGPGRARFFLSTIASRSHEKAQGDAERADDELKDANRVATKAGATCEPRSSP